jgi:hypothetical protein
LAPGAHTVAGVSTVAVAGHVVDQRRGHRGVARGQPKYQNDGDPRTSGPGYSVAYAV